MRFHLLEVLVIVDILPLLRVLQSVTLQGWRGEGRGRRKGGEERRGGRGRRKEGRGGEERKGGEERRERMRREG